MGRKVSSLSGLYLDNDLLLDAIGTVDPLDHVIGAAVLDDSFSYFDFPFEHADHKFSVEQEFSAAA